MELIGEYIESTKLVSHQIDTYNDFITRGIQTIINREHPVVTKNHIITFGHVFVDKPKFVYQDRSIRPLYPNDARIKNITYDGICYINATILSVDSNTTKEHYRLPIGRIPVMLHSNVCNLTKYDGVEHEECSNDPGGYFIIRGKERVLVGQMRPVYNKVYVYATKVDDKFCYLAEIRSINRLGASILIQAKIDSRHRIWLSLPYIKTMLPAGIVFKALGIEYNDMISYCRIDNKNISDTLKSQYYSQSTSDEAIEFIAKGLIAEQDEKYVRNIMFNELFYHVGKINIEVIGRHLGFVLKQLAMVSLGIRAIDDKELLSNKRVDSSGNLIGTLFQSLFKQFVKTVCNQLDAKKNPDPINTITNINVITHGLSSCFMTGNWSTQKSANTYTRIGVSQVLSVQSYGARISYLRRIMLPNGTKGKNPKARQLHSSQFHFICPYETPEGETVGLVTNLALTADITINIPMHEIEELIRTSFVTFSKSYDYKNLILLNGKIIGSTKSAYEFKNEFNEYRKSDTLDSYISIVHLRHADEIHIFCDDGRFMRPLFLVSGKDNYVQYLEDKRNNSIKSWKQYVDSGDIVFRDAIELEHSVIAMDELDLKRNLCDYLEICPAGTMMGLMASVIPFANHSQAPRNAYQASMGKQAMGIPCESFQYRYDTTLHVIDYPQKPITKNKMLNIVKFNEMSHGAMPIVAICTDCGFNQEDSVILNKASIDRGLFTAHTYKTIVKEEQKRGNSDFETICLPKYQYRRRDYNYTHLDDDGIVKRTYGLYLKQGDIIIGKTNNRIEKSEEGVRELKTTDASVPINHGEEGYLDSVVDTINNEGIRIIKVRIRIPRIPEIGDKFASSTAQKGTCGMIFSQEDMPFDKNGIVPDLIINPHAIPSRMTINMLNEMALNLVSCVTGKEQDATTFDHPNIEKELDDHLKDLGWDTYSSTMYSGFTGKRFPSKIFMAPAFYQRLKHMVSDKIHARAAGPIENLTHQPVAGRSREGGLKFGEMDRDAHIGHGSSRLLKEHLYDLSDKYQIPICGDCGNIPHNRKHCHICDSDNVQMKIMPYATKLFNQYLMGMGIKLIMS